MLLILFALTQFLIMCYLNHPFYFLASYYASADHCVQVISGHLGWVRCTAVDVSNEWFATGSADRTIKIWDLASGQLKLTLTGHVRGKLFTLFHYPY